MVIDQSIRHFGTLYYILLDIMGLDIMGLDIMGLDIMGLDILGCTLPFMMSSTTPSG